MTKMSVRVQVTGLIIAIIGGAALTWLSGFLRPLLPEKSVDVLQWGSPFPYLHKVVTFPGPPFVDWSTAAVDFVIWTILFIIIMYVVWISRCKGERTP
jgi:hypothetical protein